MDIFYPPGSKAADEPRIEPFSRATSAESDQTLAQTHRLDVLFEWLVALVAGLTPLLFVPWGFAPAVMGKEILVIVLAAAAAIVWISRAMATGALVFTKSYWHIPLALLIAVAVASTLFSVLPLKSIWQIESPSESLAGILTAAVLAFLVMNAPRPESVFRKMLQIALPVSFVLGVINILSLFGKQLLPFSFAQTPGFTLVGSQNAFALFAAFGVLMTLASAKIQWLKHWRYGLAALGVVLFINLFLINFQLAWLVLALGIAAVIGVRLGEDESRDIRRIGLLIPLLVVTLVFGLLRQRLFTASVQIPIEVSPSQAATLRIAESVWREGALRTALGSGPSTFVYAWEKYRAPEINLTAFWGARFRQGASGALTSLSTLGLAGFTAYLATLLFAFIGSLRRHRVRSPEFTALFAGSFSLAAAWFLYPANFTLHTLLFVVTALLVGHSYTDKKPLDFARSPRQAVFLALALIVFLVGAIASLYRAGERYIAYAQAEAGVNLFNRQNEITASLPYFIRATSVAPQEDALQRLLAEALLVRLQHLLQPNSGASAQDLQGVLTSVIQTARNATQLNQLDSNNWATLTGAYETIIPFVDGAENFTIEGYKKWQEVTPQNPFPYVAQARASLAAADKFLILANQNKTTAAEKKELGEKRTRWLGQARESLQKAIALKADYADAHFLLAQIFDREGNLAEATRLGEETRRLDPFSVGTAFQLGFLYYRGERFEEAEREFARAITIQPNYSNARYFLGLLYDRKGQKEKAIAEFEEIERFNPQNEEVKKIAANLRAGRSALESIVPPAPAPEERETPPVEEKQGREEKTLR